MMKRKPLGAMRTRIDIQRLKSNATIEPDGHVDESLDDNWEIYISRWAAVRYLTGRESLVGDQLQGSQTVELELHSDQQAREITTAMRVKIRGTTRVLGIIAPPVDVDEMRKRVVVSCVEVKR